MKYVLGSFEILLNLGPKCLRLRVKRLWQKSEPKATPTNRPSWRKLSCRQPRGASEFHGWHSSLPPGRLAPLLHAAGGRTPKPPPFSGWDSGPSSRPAHPGLICIGTRAAPANGRAGAVGEAARAHPDSSALLVHSLVPGFRAQHGGQGDSNSLLLPLLHKRHSGDPACSP